MKSLLATGINVDGTDLTNYPYGKFKNSTTEGAYNGTRAEKQFMNDLTGMMQALMLNAGLTPDGNEETALSSQLLAAVRKAGKDGVYTEIANNVVTRQLEGTTPTWGLYSFAGGAGGTLLLPQSPTSGYSRLSFNLLKGVEYSGIRIYSQCVSTGPSTANIYANAINLVGGVVQQKLVNGTSKTLATTTWQGNMIAFDSTYYCANPGESIEVAWSNGGGSAYSFRLLGAVLTGTYTP